MRFSSAQTLFERLSSQLRKIGNICVVVPGSAYLRFDNAELAELPKLDLYLQTTGFVVSCYRTSFSPYLVSIMSDYDQDQVEGIYQPKDAVGAAIKATGVTSLAGLFVSTIQNTLTKQNVGAFGVFTRTGGTIAVFGTSFPGEGRSKGSGHRVVGTAIGEYGNQTQRSYANTSVMYSCNGWLLRVL
jgi:hypothetical protein